jgi:hypothetical protein
MRPSRPHVEGRPSHLHASQQRCACHTLRVTDL